MSKREYQSFTGGMMYGLLKKAALPDDTQMKGFDWKRAKEIICQRRQEIDVARAGLAEDWGCTSGTIFEEDEFTSDSCVYAASMWATPMLLLELKDGTEEEIDCACESDKTGFPDDWEEDCDIIDVEIVKDTPLLE